MWTVERLYIGEASYRGKRLTLAKHGKKDVLKIDDDDGMSLFVLKFQRFRSFGWINKV